jgi:hypothetical protein
MTIWFKKSESLDSETMRQAAKEDNVSWEYQTIKYKKNGIGYADGDSTDTSTIKDKIEKLTGLSPKEIDEPTSDTQVVKPSNN